jgi:hypothetical protein
MLQATWLVESIPLNRFLFTNTGSVQCTVGREPDLVVKCEIHQLWTDPTHSQFDGKLSSEFLPLSRCSPIHSHY